MAAVVPFEPQPGMLSVSEMLSVEEPGRARLAVWGAPISHSLSPALHAAAYAVLGLHWHYGREHIDETTFPAEFAARAAEPSWRGLSLTMPLKEAAFAACASVDELASLTGAVNTVRMTDAGPRGFNTDVEGLRIALAEAGFGEAQHARVLGAGRTAASAVVALARAGVARLEVRARRPEAAEQTVALAARVGLTATAVPLDAPADAVDVTVSTLPGGTVLPAPVAATLAAASPLFDVAYAPWPSMLASQWRSAGPHAAVPGASMLVHQAVRQVRVFVSGDAQLPLDGEAAVLAAMREAAELGMGE